MLLRQDLLGCVNRLQQVVIRHRKDVDDVNEQWRDARATKFLQSQLPDVEQNVKRLIIHLQKIAEFSDQIHRQIRDEIPED